MSQVRLICSKCGYTKEVFGNDMYDYNECAICGGKMTAEGSKQKRLDHNHKAHDELLGDNFPVLHKKLDIEPTEEEVINTFNLIGNNAMWEVIELINDFKIRLKYRTLFFKIGGTVPEKED